MPSSYNLWQRFIRRLTFPSRSTPTCVDVTTGTQGVCNGFYCLSSNVLVLIPDKVLATQPFRLLDLPSELQLTIFELATVTSNILLMGLRCRECDIDYSRHCTCRQDESFNTYKYPPALARVSRSIRHDVLKIFYGQDFKVFVRFSNYDWLNTWLAHVGPEYRRLMRMYIVAEGAQFVKPFADYMIAELREAGFDPVPVRCRHHDWHFSVTFREPAVERIAEEARE